jgi:hypothetical protein
MKTKLKTLLLLFVAIILSPSFKAAPPPGKDCQHWYSCEATEKYFFEFSDGTDLSQLDFGDLMYGKPQIFQENIEKCFDPNLGLTVTKTILNPDQALNPWMTRIHRSVITKDGVQMFDDNSNEIGFYPSSPLHSQFWTEIEDEISSSGFNPDVSFNFPDQDEIQDLINAGFQILEYPDGKFSYSDGVTEVIIDPVNLRIETNESEEGELKFTSLEGYFQNEAGSYLLNYKIDKVFQTLPSGICGAFVTITNYSKISTGQEFYKSKITDESKLKIEILDSPIQSNAINSFEIFPNPTSGNISLYLSNLGSGSKPVNLKITNANGEIMLEKSISHQNLINLPLDKLPAGMYIVNVSTDSYSVSKKLLKN